MSTRPAVTVLLPRWLHAAALCTVAAITTLGCGQQDEGIDLEADFRAFFDTYVQEIDQRNVEYLRGVHPDLPSEMHEFFFDATQSMMKHADEQGHEPAIECFVVGDDAGKTLTIRDAQHEYVFTGS